MPSSFACNRGPFETRKGCLLLSILATIISTMAGGAFFVSSSANDEESHPYGSHAVQWVGTASVKGPKWGRLPLLTVGMLGIQCVWSIEMGYGTSFTTGVDHIRSSWLFARTVSLISVVLRLITSLTIPARARTL